MCVLCGQFLKWFIVQVRFEVVLVRYGVLICLILFRQMILVLGLVWVISVFICLGVRFCVLFRIRQCDRKVWLCMKFIEWILMWLVSRLLVVWWFQVLFFWLCVSIFRLLVSVFIYGVIFFFLVFGRKLMFLLMLIVVWVMMILWQCCWFIVCVRLVVSVSRVLLVLVVFSRVMKLIFGFISVLRVKFCLWLCVLMFYMVWLLWWKLLISDSIILLLLIMWLMCSLILFLFGRQMYWFGYYFLLFCVWIL